MFTKTSYSGNHYDLIPFGFVQLSSCCQLGTLSRCLLSLLIGFISSTSNIFNFSLVSLNFAAQLLNTNLSELVNKHKQTSQFSVVWSHELLLNIKKFHLTSTKLYLSHGSKINTMLRSHPLLATKSCLVASISGFKVVEGDVDKYGKVIVHSVQGFLSTFYTLHNPWRGRLLFIAWRFVLSPTQNPK